MVFRITSWKHVLSHAEVKLITSSKLKGNVNLQYIILKWTLFNLKSCFKHKQNIHIEKLWSNYFTCHWVWMPMLYYIADVNCDCFARSGWKVFIEANKEANRTSAKWAEFAQNLCLLDCRYRATTSYNQSFRERQSCYMKSVSYIDTCMHYTRGSFCLHLEFALIRFNWKSFTLRTESRFNF